MVHKPKHKVHSFRGLLGDGGQDEIRLERQNVNVAYRIFKFQIMPNNPGAASYEHCVKVFREKQASVTNIIDFDDVDLLGAAIYHDDTAADKADAGPVIIFDNTLFSRNIYVTAFENVASPGESVNYYIEIEEVPVGAATLIQIKLGTARRIKTTESMG